MSEQTHELFLGRQPILDRNQNLAAFELLFRSGHFNGAQIEDAVFASATVINHAFSELGVEGELVFHTDPCHRIYCAMCDLDDCGVRREPFRDRPPLSLEEAVQPDMPRT